MIMIKEVPEGFIVQYKEWDLMVTKAQLKDKSYRMEFIRAHGIVLPNREPIPVSSFPPAAQSANGPSEELKDALAKIKPVHHEFVTLLYEVLQCRIMQYDGKDVTHLPKVNYTDLFEMAPNSVIKEKLFAAAASTSWGEISELMGIPPMVENL